MYSYWGQSPPYNSIAKYTATAIGIHASAQHEVLLQRQDLGPETSRVVTLEQLRSELEVTTNHVEGLLSVLEKRMLKAMVTIAASSSH